MPSDVVDTCWSVSGGACELLTDDELARSLEFKVTRGAWAPWLTSAAAEVKVMALTFLKSKMGWSPMSPPYLNSTVLLTRW